MSRRTLQSLLERLGLHRPELRAWAMYDWANSAYYVVIITAIFPIYYQKVAAAGIDKELATQRFGWATTLALALVAILSPILGAYADYRAVRKRMLGGFLTLGVATTASLYFVQQGDWLSALILFALGNVAIATSFVFYDSLLPHIASVSEVDRVSAAGYALGYLGGGLLMLLNVLWIVMPESFGIVDSGVATRLSFLSVALWWGAFSIPLFQRVPEPPRVIEADERSATSAVHVTFTRLAETFRELTGSYKQAALLLLAMLVYNDGIGTVIRMAAIYAETLGLPTNDVITAILLVQFVGIPFSFLFGSLAGRIGAKRSILLGLGVYAAITVVAYKLETVREFYLLAILVAMVQGGTQALSRSLFATMTPKHKTSEFFGFFSVFEKFSGILGPLLFSLMIALSGSSRNAILAVSSFFVVGGLILVLVNVEEGRRRASEAEKLLLDGEGENHPQARP